jgi:hypothetical protein
MRFISASELSRPLVSASPRFAYYVSFLCLYDMCDKISKVSLAARADECAHLRLCHFTVFLLIHSLDKYVILYWAFLLKLFYKYMGRFFLTGLPRLSFQYITKYSPSLELILSR